MDHYQYQPSHSNGVPAHQQQQQQHHPQSQQQQPLTPISNITSNHNHSSFHHNDSSAQPNILPPLHGQHNGHYAYHPPSSYKSGLHQQHDSGTSRVPHTPDTPSSVAEGNTSLPHLAPQTHMNVAEPQVSTYAAAGHGYQDTSPSTYHASSQQATGFPINGLPQYSQPSSSHLSSSVNGMYDRGQQQPPPYGYAPQAQPEHSFSQDEGRPMPVVGSQGRRGILPSLGTRPPPPGSTPDGSVRGVAQPSKNADNKYPCNFCNKTYLHLKHLKRHHLRHTGERPYQCGLCHETFCRSDILKRHFNKCAIRRGNPSGANHLTHAQAHLNKPPRSAPNSSNGTTAPPPMSALTSISTNQPPSSYHQGPWSATTGRSSATTSLEQNTFPIGDSTRTSRSSSLMGPDPHLDEDRKRFSTGASLAPMNGSMQSTSNGVAGHDRPFSYPFGADRQMHPTFRDANGNGFQYHTTMAPQPEQQLPPMSGYSRTNGWPSQYSNSTDNNSSNWSDCFNPNGQDSLMYSGHH